MKKIGVAPCLLCKDLISFYVEDKDCITGKVIEKICIKCLTINHMAVPEKIGDFFFVEPTPIGFNNRVEITVRQRDNFAILALLREYVEKYPDIRFNQMLQNTRIIDSKDLWYEESYITLKSIHKTRLEEKW